MVTTWAFTGSQRCCLTSSHCCHFLPPRLCCLGLSTATQRKNTKRHRPEATNPNSESTWTAGKEFRYWQRTALLKHSSSKQIGSQADRQMENADVRVQEKKKKGKCSAYNQSWVEWNITKRLTLHSSTMIILWQWGAALGLVFWWSSSICCIILPALKVL